MRQRKSGPWPWVALLLATGLFVFAGPLDIAARLLNYLTLTEAEIVKDAQAYLDERADLGQAACLYVVTCDGGEARLTLVPDLTDDILEQVREDVWHRRTSGFCPGRTTNIGLELVPKDGGEPLGSSQGLARWSFFNDRFVSRSSRSQSGSFSEEPWEPCTLGRAFIRNTPALSPQTPPPVSADH
ncbi:MAG: hypothetical protein M3Q74_11185 [Pseudomonadota bacterium]|nr:hypothetical protein [Pseudomonadota bacterium]